MFRKQFDAWISRNFKGLSAYTLYQYLVKFHGFSESYADEIVFVKLFNYFTKKIAVIIIRNYSMDAKK